MTVATRPLFRDRPSLDFVLLLILLAVLWCAGGASRADAVAQALVRAATWGLIAAALLLGARPNWRAARVPGLLLIAAILFVGVQLIPLPPGLWQALPGRAAFIPAASLAGIAQPWRPLAIVPDGAINAVSALAVPAAVLLLASGSTPADRARLPGVLLFLVGASACVGVLQFSGAGMGNPLLNYAAGDVSGTFANRNHFALLLAVGCVIVPTWAIPTGSRLGWRLPVGGGLLLLFLLMAMASGSRAGLALTVLGIALGLAAAGRGLRRSLRRSPRGVVVAAIAGAVLVLGAVLWLSLANDRALAVERMMGTGAEQELRQRSLPVVLGLVWRYFPFGTGFGSFDAVFRMHEPYALLATTYLNHAHNDVAEIALEGGLAGLLLLAVGLGWWAIASLRAWRSAADAPGAGEARIGSAVLLLVLAGSLSDYPGRTPLIMAVAALAALWLGAIGKRAPASTLPGRDSDL